MNSFYLAYLDILWFLANLLGTLKHTHGIPWLCSFATMSEVSPQTPRPWWSWQILMKSPPVTASTCSKTATLDLQSISNSAITYTGLFNLFCTFKDKHVNGRSKALNGILASPAGVRVQQSGILTVITDIQRVGNAFLLMRVGTVAIASDPFLNTSSKWKDSPMLIASRVV